MARSLVAVALVVLAGAPAAYADEDLDVPGRDGDLRGDALVWEDANLYLEPWEGGLSVRLSPYGRARGEMVGNVVPVRITSSAMRQFVEIELPERLDCAWRRWAPDRRVEALRLFVHREDLAPVLVKPFAIAHSDGTRVKLAPGVPVMPTSSGQYTIAARGDRLRLPIPHASVGYVYSAGRVVEPEQPASGKLFRLDRTTSVLFDGEAFAVRAPWMMPEPTVAGGRSLVHWATRCIDLVVEITGSTLRPVERPRPPAAPAAPPALKPTGYYIPAGAPLATQSGRDVAVSAIAIPVPAPNGEAACFDATIAINKVDDITYPQQFARTVKLCAPARLVERDN